MDSKLNQNNILNGLKFRKASNSEESESIDLTSFTGVKVIGLYFANTMSYKSRAYTKALKDLYSIINRNEKILEIIFITAEEEESIIQDLNRMPWYYKIEEYLNADELKAIFEAYDLPKLVIMSPSGVLIHKNIAISNLTIDNFNRLCEKTNQNYDIKAIRQFSEIKHK